MPGFDHELQVRLFQKQPALAPLMLRDTIGFPVPDFARAELGCGDHTKLTPQSFKSDKVVVLYDHDCTKVLAIITEVQQKVDEDKPYTWPLYLATVREELRCPVRLMVVCPDNRTERWARTPIELETGGAVLRPAVLGPSNTPVVDDIDRAKRLPKLAVLSAAAHGDNPAVLKAAESALDGLPEHTRLVYYDFIESKLSAAARLMWEELMATGTYEWQSDFARKYVGQGREEGLEEGREAGLVQGKREALLRLLDVLPVSVGPDARRRIEECADSDRLDTWITRAVGVKHTDELFD
ncbi:hypothetical protein GCM10007079_03510 [Nocardiopsis terrae]|uniref:Transposase, YhgA-like n=1 Tax=Nocardiopsis terrae TaxID=372655 RepID=A0ABR9HN04_9ACTN|nr:hypothetical protein [Nocardiopsis terrae]MBE1460402.1 hypothetical protein [Nocardiopsis terrae]GHC71278.1 hypothetical protein GCM10007079_03510 [Nocardiopsis terrae]